MSTGLTYDEAIRDCETLGYTGKIDKVFDGLAYVWTSDNSYCAMVQYDGVSWEVVAQETFVCTNCGRRQPEVRGLKPLGESGYSYSGSNRSMVCFDCTGDLERGWMTEHGKTTLYLTEIKDENGKFTSTRRQYIEGKWVKSEYRFRLELSDCIGSYKIPIEVSWTGRHNMADEVRFIRFIGPDGFVWSGKHLGRWSDLCHCRRTKIPPKNIRY